MTKQHYNLAKQEVGAGRLGKVSFLHVASQNKNSATSGIFLFICIVSPTGESYVHEIHNGEALLGRMLDPCKG
jgi:hypothetical protein